MPNPFNFNLSERAKLLVVVLSIFLISLSVGMLVFGTNESLHGNLNTQTIHQGTELLNLIK